MLEGTRTLNPQIRSLMRYPLRHEHNPEYEFKALGIFISYQKQKKYSWRDLNSQSSDS